MSYNVDTISIFDKQVKRLAKKYPSIKSDIARLIESLSVTPNLGEPLGNKFFKIRMAITSKGKGKSAGARVITYFKVTNDTVFLTALYDKSEQSTITDEELDAAFKLIP